MIGIDSNVLVRYLLDDDPVWSPIATRFVEEELTTDSPGYVNLVVLAETVWALRRSPLFERSKLAVVIEGLLQFEKFVIEDRDVVARALARFRSNGASFADLLIAELNLAAGVTATVTIDRLAARKPPFTRLTDPE